MTTSVSTRKKGALSPLQEFHALVTPILKKGTPLYLLRGLKKEHIETLFALGYTLYSKQKYHKALEVFQTMALYNHCDKRAWMGIAATSQLLKDYSTAITAYASAALIDGKDPLPAFHAVACYLALHQKAEALQALEAVLLLSSDSPEHKKITQEALRIQHTLSHKRS